MTDILLEAKALTKHFPVTKGIIFSKQIGAVKAVDGIDFTIPGGTTISAGGYLVVVADSSYMSQVYGGIPMVGNFSGQLSNGGELVRLEDATGNLVDNSGFGNDGVPLGGAAPTAGKVGGAYRFSGQTGERVEIPHQPQYDSATALTIEAWVNKAPGKPIRPLTTSCSGGSYGLWINGAVKADVVNHVSNAIIPDSEWTHVTWTFNSAIGRSRIYLNGILDSEIPVSDPLVLTTQPLLIGSCAFTGDQGAIDEVALYVRELSPREVRAGFDAGPRGHCKTTGPVSRSIMSCHTSRL